MEGRRPFSEEDVRSRREEEIPGNSYKSSLGCNASNDQKMRKKEEGEEG